MELTLGAVLLVQTPGKKKEEKLKGVSCSDNLLTYIEYHEVIKYKQVTNLSKLICSYEGKDMYECGRWINYWYLNESVASQWMWLPLLHSYLTWWYGNKNLCKKEKFILGACCNDKTVPSLNIWMGKCFPFKIFLFNLKMR